MPQGASSETAICLIPFASFYGQRDVRKALEQHRVRRVIPTTRLPTKLLQRGVGDAAVMVVGTGVANPGIFDRYRSCQ